MDGGPGKSGRLAVPGRQAGGQAGRRAGGGFSAEPRGTLCSFYLFILSAGGRPGPPYTLLGPELELVGRDGGRSAGKRGMAHQVHVSQAEYE